MRVLDLTRILAGPVAGRTLAAHGADVLLVNSPRLPNIAAIADTSRGKRSAHLDLEDAAGRATLGALALGADVFVQGYRPRALAARGFGAEALAARAPGLVVASLSAYGTSGPWAGRRGFDSLVQTATGMNVAEAEAFDSPTPKALPIPILDFAAGHLLAAGIAAALWRQRTQGGSWHVRLTLAGVARWLRALGRVPDGPRASAPALTPFLDEYATGFGLLRAPRHSAVFSATPPHWDRPSMPPGTHEPSWSGAEA